MPGSCTLCYTQYRTLLGPEDLQLNTRLGGRNFYWNDSDGHIWEVLTVSYARPQLGAPVGLASS